MSVEGPDISKYGVVRPGPVLGQVAKIFENPPLLNVASDLVSMIRYILTPRVFEVLRSQCLGCGGEIQLSDAINTLTARDQVQYVSLTGLRFDCGSVEGRVVATLYIDNSTLHKSQVDFN